MTKDAAKAIVIKTAIGLWITLSLITAAMVFAATVILAAALVS
jgi:hypothetical protein